MRGKQLSLSSTVVVLVSTTSGGQTLKQTLDSSSAQRDESSGEISAGSDAVRASTRYTCRLPILPRASRAIDGSLVQNYHVASS
ncbi:hypothetical protein COLO4_13766 [Corchorus olitorius]|uniref:Secreted protein n=1 Tax=Corchorus olitorius TaxID=93759 RepID=A0A1R3JUZ2_9ROSI|nr:hypothetical protein COLO4_13766 [Corchorus olitorius]